MPWEDFICLNSGKEPAFKLLAPAKDWLHEDARRHEWSDLDYKDALELDRVPLPTSIDREGYYGPHHFSYWASGLKDTISLLERANTYGVTVKDYLDFGCASGRVLRHFAIQHPEIRSIGCDINRLHVEWCNTYLPDNCTTFQNHAIPSLPLEDSSLDLISAFSVFTHIESLETTWLMEIKRVLRPGGLAWITVHTEHTLQEMTEDWPLWKPVMKHRQSRKLLDSRRNFKGNRLVLRLLENRSYASNVFYKLDYLKEHWSRIFDIVEVLRRFPTFQDVLILRKRS